MCKISLNIPESALYNLCMNQIEAAKQFKLIVAYYCYINTDISFDDCVAISELSKKEFIRYILDNKSNDPMINENGWPALYNLRKQAEVLPDITLDEINNEINTARTGLEAV